MQFPVDFAPLLIALVGCLLWFAVKGTASCDRAGSAQTPLSNARRGHQSDPRDRFQAVRLDRSSLCLDCQTVNESAGDTCYVCGATGSLLSLARVLDGHIAATLPETNSDSMPIGQLKIISRNYAHR